MRKEIRLSEHFTFKKLLRFTLPSIAMMVFGSVYSIIDGVFVSNFVGKTSFAAVNLMMPFLMMFSSVGFMVGTGGSALIAKTLGEKNSERARKLFSVLVYFALPNRSLLRLGKPLFDAKALLRVCTNSSSELVTNLSMSLVNMLYNFQLMRYVGESGVVAFGVIMYVCFIFLSVYMGYSIGSAPIVSFNYGAENHNELRAVLRKSLTLIFFMSLAMTAASELLARGLASVFVGYDTQLLDFTTNAFRLYALSFLFAGFNIYSSSFFTALNNGLVSAGISFSRTLLFETAAVLLLPCILGVKGIWLSMTFAELFAFVLSCVMLVALSKRYHYR